MLNLAGKNLTFECWKCGLHIGRTYVTYPGAQQERTRAQGRPLAGLMLLGQHCPREHMDTTADRDKHRQFWNNAFLSHAKKVSMRKTACVLAERDPGLNEMICAERDPVEGFDVNGEAPCIPRL